MNFFNRQLFRQQMRFDLLKRMLCRSAQKGHFYLQMAFLFLPNRVWAWDYFQKQPYAVTPVIYRFLSSFPTCFCSFQKMKMGRRQSSACVDVTDEMPVHWKHPNWAGLREKRQGPPHTLFMSDLAKVAIIPNFCLSWFKQIDYTPHKLPALFPFFDI